MGILDFLSGKTNKVEKPGKYCFHNCAGLKAASDKCGGCVQLQNKFESIVYEIEQLEAASEYTPEQIREMNKEHKKGCPQCGAPVQAGASFCPYCGTRYEVDSLSLAVPVNKVERNKAYDQKLEEAWECWLDINDVQLAVLKEQQERRSGIMKVLGGANLAMQATRKSLEQDSTDIKKAAEHYGILPSQYLVGITSAKYLIWRAIVQQQNAAQANANRQAASQQVSRPAPKRYTMLDYQSQRARNYNPGYNGGADRYCGNCMYWYNGHCSCHDYSSNASDHCGCWKLK